MFKKDGAENFLARHATLDSPDLIPEIRPLDIGSITNEEYLATKTT